MTSLRTICDHCLHEARLFFIALQFFTRIPIPHWVGFEPAWLQHSSRYFPMAGVVVACATAVVYAGAAWLWSPLVAVLVSTAFGIYLTGAFHEDGFADMCDGFGGGLTPARVLEIMRDSRIGAYGAIGIGLMLALKCATLAQLPVQSALAALLVAHPLSRLASGALIWRLTYVREDGKAKPLSHRMSHGEFAIAALTAAVPALACLLAGWMSWRAFVAGAVLAVVAMLWLAKMFVRRIGGYTGDCLGAVQQASEVAFYLGVLALAGR